MRGLLYIILLVAFTSCGFSSSHPRALDDAQRLMHTDPAAALSKLNAVDVSEIQDSAIVARWALLYSEALVANQLSAPTDTIVNVAVDYYSRHNLQDEFHKASRLKALIKASGNSDALATALYLQKEKEFFLYKERAMRERLVLAGLAVLLAAAGAVAWMRQRVKLQASRNEALIAEASCLRDRVDATRDDIGRLETKLHRMLENRFELIDSLCQTYYESQGTKTERKAIADKVKGEIEAVRDTAFPKMEEAVNDCRGNLLAKVKERCPGIKCDDYRLLVYLASGLSTRTISLLLNESVEVVYKRKSRLKSRMRRVAEAGCPEIMDVF